MSLKKDSPSKQSAAEPSRAEQPIPFERARARRDAGLAAEPNEVRRFERRLRHPPEKVWRALTEPGELARWFPASVDARPEKGASLRFVFADGAEPDAEGRVTECDPPRLLVYTMGEETLRWELSRLPDDGCLLVFTTEMTLARAAVNDNGDTISARLAA